MMLFLAIVCTVVAVAVALFIAFAQGMSDAPGSTGWRDFRAVYWLAAIAIALWICWYFGWHPS